MQVNGDVGVGVDVVGVVAFRAQVFWSVARCLSLLVGFGG